MNDSSIKAYAANAVSAANSNNKQKFKFDLSKFTQNNQENKDNTTPKNLENTDLSLTNLQSNKKGTQNYELSIFERNKLKKFINVQKDKNDISTNKISFGNFDKEIDLENFNFNINNQSTISINSRNSSVSRLTSKDFGESPMKILNGNQFFNGMRVKPLDSDNNINSEINKGKLVYFIFNSELFYNVYFF